MIEINKMNKSEEIKYIDLFSGIGGFHQALDYFNSRCVFSSEIDKFAIETYKENYSLNSDNDITTVLNEDIPHHDLLCAGFPCQTFSKAGNQDGMEDTRGTLFFEIARILQHHKPKYILLENVRNLVSHDNHKTWKIITNTLLDLGYRLTKEPLILSPHHFGVPQLRERVFIPGIYDPENINIPIEIDNFTRKKKNSNTIYSILDHSSIDNSTLSISKEEEEIIDIWDKFYDGIKNTTIGFPIWFDYLDTMDINDQFPLWKQEIIRKNQDLYLSNKEFIDEWKIKFNAMDISKNSYRKFEWQAGDEISSCWEGLIQFRPSGVRVKRPDVFPALVAMVQTPIIGKFKRRISLSEAQRLQSFNEDFIPNPNQHQAYKQFGNSVNVKVVTAILESLLKYDLK